MLAKEGFFTVGDAALEDVGDAALEYRFIPGTGAEVPPLVFLHEGLGSLALWGEVPARIAARTGAAVLVYSRRGYGRSSPLRAPRTPCYLHDEALRVLPAVLAQAGLARPILFGHSDGASIALIYAGAHPDAVAGLILEAPHVFVEDMTVAAIAKIGAAARETALLAKLARYHDDSAASFWGWNRIWLDPAFRSWRIIAELPAITAPLLLIQGADDEYGSLAQIDAITSAVAGPALSLILADCGHSPHRDQYTAVEDAAAAFVEKIGGNLRF